MTHAVYVGPIAHLKGETALLKPSSQSTPGTVAAQFDDRTLTLSGEGFGFDGPECPPDALGFGWHDFPAEHFQEIYEEAIDE